MELILKFETTELKLIKEESHYNRYNRLMYEIKSPKMGITHLRESYDDVCSYPSYDLGILKDDKLKVLMLGEGNPIPENCEETGGIWIEIQVFNPERSLILASLIKD
jgi:hypothetical protein